MNREEGIRALREASKVLSRAARAKEDNRENLASTTAFVIGGLGQAVDSLADLLEDGTPNKRAN